MTAKEKAKELVNKYKNPFDRKGCIPPTETIFNSTAKQCALIAVDELINYSEEWDDSEYWQEIKQEIINL